jgi:hypothetical protein
MIPQILLDPCVRFYDHDAQAFGRMSNILSSLIIISEFVVFSQHVYPELFIKNADAFCYYCNIRGYFDIALDSYHTFLKQNSYTFIGTFYPSGEPVSLHRHRCSPG